MGLSSKQVYNDGSDWNQTLLQDQLPKPSTGRRQQQPNQQQSEPVKCPRCDSTNTKFCYYNNYNKSQPRHFCKSCKRHWTKGGTLRNVPVGGGRKNKRLKSSKNSNKTVGAAATAFTTNTTGSTITTTRINPHMAIQAPQQKQNLPIAYSDKKNASETTGRDLVSLPSSILQQNSISCLNFLYSNTSSFDTNPSSISTSFQFPNVHSYSTGKTMEDSIITSIMPDTRSSSVSQHQELWQVPNASRGMDMTNYWNWDDIDNFVSTTNLNLPWDDSELKP